MDNNEKENCDFCEAHGLDEWQDDDGRIHSRCSTCKYNWTDKKEKNND